MSIGDQVKQLIIESAGARGVEQEGLDLTRGDAIAFGVTTTKEGRVRMNFPKSIFWLEVSPDGADALADILRFMSGKVRRGEH